VDLSTPVYDANGHFIGVLCGHLSLDWAFEVREAMLDQLATDQLDVVVLNREGKVLMGTPRLPSLKVDLSNLSSYQGLAKNTRQVALEVWPDGQRYLTAAVRETPFRNYSGMGWVVMARKSEAAAFGPADVLSHSILAAGLATAVVFMLVLVFVLHRRLRPLEAISAAAQRLQADDLQAVIPVPEGNDELAVFARSLAGLVRTLQQRNDDLRLAARVFNESGQGILIADAQNRIVRINRAFSRITGYASDEVLGPMPSVLSSGRHSAAFYESMWQTLSRQGTWQGEIWNRSKLGQVYPEWLSIDTLRNEQGEVTHYIGIFDDITEKKEYERRLVHLANYDVLTDLPNRNLFEKEVLGLIARISQNNQGLALMFVDLDNLNP
jgi:PAS domain S-box-containing protein